MDEQASAEYHFGPFRLIPRERQLLRDDQPIALPPKAFDTLVVLVRNSGHALKKDELIKQVWPDSFVEESNLSHNISVLRKALGDNGNGEGLLETVRGYGFRFKGEVNSTAEGESVVMRRRTRTHVVFREEEEQSRETTSVIGEQSRRPVIIAVGIVATVIAISAIYFGYLRGSNAKHPLTGRAGPGASENGDAQLAYAQGRYFWNRRNPDDILRAQRYFHEALQIDPNFAPAYVGLADCLMTGGSIPGMQETPKSLALKALRIDDQLGEAHATIGYYVGAIEWDWEGAEREFEKAVQLKPEYATARHWHAYNLASLGRLDEALSEIKKAETLDPISVIIKTDVGHILYFARRYDEAVTQYLKALQLNPDFRVAHWRLGEAYTQLGRYDEAIVHLQKAIDLEKSKESGAPLWIAYAKAAANDSRGALQLLNQLKLEAQVRDWNYDVAAVYARLGDSDSAFAWLETAFRNREGQIALIKVEPKLEPLRKDARYAALLKRMNLE